MNAGELNRQITLQSETVEYDSYNEPIPAWTDTSTVWASVITTGGREFYAAQKLDAETSAVFKVRYSSSITVLMRIKYGTRIFNILSLNDVDAMRKELLINAKEVV